MALPGFLPSSDRCSQQPGEGLQALAPQGLLTPASCLTSSHQAKTDKGNVLELLDISILKAPLSVEQFGSAKSTSGWKSPNCDGLHSKPVSSAGL